jgi:hypothetical protein
MINVLIALFFCHWLADFTWLSNSWMLNAKRFGKPFFPILVHAAVHAILMSAALFIMGVNDPLTLFRLYSIQLITHFVIDVWKGRMNGWFPTLQNPANKWHWVIFGWDQYLHALVIILMVQYLFS